LPQSSALIPAGAPERRKYLEHAAACGANRSRIAEQAAVEVLDDNPAPFKPRGKL
jgi:hypothetical protein